MADGAAAQNTLHGAEPTPVAQLHPEIADPRSRVIDGVITITWPYSIVKKSIAFILAERDFRLRRERGQVRIEFYGAAGRAIAESGVGGGDDVRLSLDGVEWQENVTAARPAGSTLEWQLKFTKRLVLEVRRADSQDLENINIDAQDDEPEQVEPVLSPAEPPTPEPATPVPSTPLLSVPSKRSASSSDELGEFASPAFVKRARVSYGALYEGGLDVFDEVGLKGKARKPSRFSMGQSSWRYSSRSISPEADDQSKQDDSFAGHSRGNAVDHSVPGTPTRSLAATSMIDEGCQTQELDFTGSINVDVLAEPRQTEQLPSLAHVALPGHGELETENQLAPRSPRLTSADIQVQHDVPRSAITFDTTYQQASHPQLGFGFDFAAPESSIGQELPTATTAPLHLDAPAVTATQEGNIEAMNYSQPSVPAGGLFNEVPMAVDLGFQLQEHSQPQATPYPELSHEYQPQPNPFYGMPRPEHEGWAAGPAAAAFPLQDFRNDEENAIELVDGTSPAPVASPPEVYDSPYLEAHREVELSEEPQGRALGDPDLPQRRVPDIDSGNHSTGTDVEAEFRDGGDEPGDDYDLRNYDRAHDDDDEIGSEESYLEESDPDAQRIAPEDDEEEESYDQDDVEDVNSGHRQGDSPSYEVNSAENGPRHATRDYELSEGEDEEFDSQEEEYSGDEEDEEGYDDENAGPSRVPVSSAPQEPVFISLLSDSEDEDEDENEDEPPVKTHPASPAEEPSEPVAESPFESAATSPSDTHRGPSQLDSFEDDRQDESEAESETNGAIATTTASRVDTQPEVTEHDYDQSMGEADDDDDDDEMEEREPELKGAGDTVPSPEEIGAKDPKPHVSVVASSPLPTADQELREATGSPYNAVDEFAIGSIRPENTGQDVCIPATLDDTSGARSRAGALDAADSDIMDVDHLEAEVLVAHSSNAAAETEETSDIKTIVSVEIMETTAEHKASSAESQLDQSQAISTKGVFTQPLELIPEPHLTQDQESSQEETRRGGEKRVRQSSDFPDISMQGTQDLVEEPITLEGDTQSNEEAEDATTLRDTAAAEKTVPLSSPPLTQTSQKEFSVIGQQKTSPEISTEVHDDIPQLPTPNETQQHDEMASEPISDPQAGPEDDDENAAEEQLMAEFQEYSQLSAHGHDTAVESEVAGSSSPAAQPETVDAQDEGQAEEAHAEPETPAAHYSFRSRRGKQTRSTAVPAVMVHTASISEPEVANLSSPTAQSETTDARDEGKADEAAKESEPPTAHHSFRGRKNRRVKSTDAKAKPAEPHDEQIEHALESEPGKPKDEEPVEKASQPEPTESREEPTKESSPKPEPPTHYSFRKHRRTRSTDAYPAPSPRSSNAKDTPPRSLRVRSIQANEIDPNVSMANITLSPAKSTRSHDTTRETRSMTQSVRRSNSPDTIRDALRSSSVTESVAEVETVSSLKTELARSLRNNLPEALPLNALRNSLNKTIDVLAVVATTPEQPYRPKNGPRDYMLELTLTDPSKAPDGVSTAHVFRPHQASLPVVQGGDVVLLRRFQVVSMKGRGFGIRASDASAWAVFEKGDEEMLPQIKGPPVELMDEEVAYAVGLRRWWGVLDEKAMARVEKASDKAAQAAGKDNRK